MIPVATLILDDSALDRILDDLVVAAGGERGWTSPKLNLARWDLKEALMTEADRQKGNRRTDFNSPVQLPLPPRKDR